MLTAFGIYILGDVNLRSKLKANMRRRLTHSSRLLCTGCLLLIFACAETKQPNRTAIVTAKTEDLRAVLDTIWDTEQTPIRLRDSAINKFGADSEQARRYQSIYEENHTLNEKKIREILDRGSWPELDVIGEQGNWTICNVIQHAENDIRIQYLPMMRQAVKDKKLAPRFLVRAEDRIATERGDLQVYGGQMKYYPETKNFNLWPVYDPANIDKRRAEIGLEPIAEFLKNRFNFEWNLEEQIKRSEAFEKEREKKQN